MKERIILTAIWVDRGIVGVICPDGKIRTFRQSGITKIAKSAQFNEYVKRGLLREDVMEYPVIPENVRIYIENNPKDFGCKTHWYPKIFSAK